MEKLFVGAIALLALLPLNVALANDLSWEAGLQAQHFWEEAQSEEQSSDNLSGSLQASYYHDWNDGLRQFVATPFYREDGSDPERSQFDLREFYVLESLDQADVYLGLRKVFWGVTETLHLVDIVNQSDTVEDPSGEDKLGQPMLSATWFADNGDWDFFLLPYFRERTFPGAEGRFRPSLRQPGFGHASAGDFIAQSVDLLGASAQESRALLATALAKGAKIAPSRLASKVYLRFRYLGKSLASKVRRISH